MRVQGLSAAGIVTYRRWFACYVFVHIVLYYRQHKIGFPPDDPDGPNGMSFGGTVRLGFDRGEAHFGSTLVRKSPFFKHMSCL